MRRIDFHSPSWLRAAVIASALCVVLASRVFVSFDSLRVKLVKSPVAAADGLVRIETITDPRAATLPAPVAVIAIVTNPAGSPQTVTIVADGRPVCDVTVAARSSERVDCVATDGWRLRPDHRIDITGPPSGWTLEFLEIATHHGSTRHALPFLVLPDITHYQEPEPLAIAVSWLLIFGVLLVPPAIGWPLAAVRTHLIASGAIAVLMAGMVASPWLTSYRVVMPLSAFVKAAVVLLASRLWYFRLPIGAATRWLFRHRPRWRPVASAGVVALTVMAAFGAVEWDATREFDGNVSGLIRVSASGFDQSPLFTGRQDIRNTLVLQPNEGYDGQFFYFASFDPFMWRFHADPAQYRDVVDAPPYRFGRIGFVWLVRTVAWERWQQYPAVMVGLLLAGVALAGFIVARIAQQAGASVLWGLIVLAVPGFWQSTRLVLPEPLAAAFLLLGYWCVRQRQILPAAAAFAISLLIRETGAVFVIAIALLIAQPGLSRRDRLWLLAALLPLALWRLHVAWVLWPEWGLRGLFMPSNNVGMPFEGLRRLWLALAAGDYHPRVPEIGRAAIWFPVLLAAVSATTLLLTRWADRFLSVALLAYALISLSFTYPKVWGHVGNVQRVSYELFVVFALASLGFRQYPRYLKAAIAVCWSGAVVFILYGAHDAFAIREGLMLWK